MRSYYVYILHCADDSYYTGVTNSIERRLKEHKDGINETAYTHSRRPLKLVWQESFYDIREAIKFEKQIKGWSRKKKKALIDGEWDDLIRFSKNYSEYGKP